MLSIVIPGKELYDENTNSFVSTDSTTLELEHSLVSISKWETKWEKAFLGPREKTVEETMSYIEMMCLNTPVGFDVLSRLDDTLIDEINTYINAKMSATFVLSSGNPQKTKQDVVTSELVYYWMSSFSIPIECEKWHFSRLLNLIKIASEKNAPANKRSSRPSQASLSQRAEINRQRRAASGTNG